MSKNIRKNRLLVISDTAVQREGKAMLAFEPVLRELEALEQSFDEIIWLGCRICGKSTTLKASNSSKIKVVDMPGTSYRAVNGLRVLLNYPVFLFYILRYLPSATHVHTRAPSHPAALGMLFSFFDRKRIYWHKYAGDWITPNAPFTYRLQRKWLKALQFHNVRVTVNGKWQSDAAHIYAFENPCFYIDEQDDGLRSASEKDFSSALSLLFVGNVDSNKGISELIDAIYQYDIPSAFTDLYVVGNGPMLQEIKMKAARVSKIRIHVIGHVNRTRLNDYYKKCHILILPSRSEGFPKVVAEAAMHGCIPVATDISSLSQYITTGVNGYLLCDNRPETIAETLHLLAAQDNLITISQKATLLSNKFTYEHFVDRIKGEIFNA